MKKVSLPRAPAFKNFDPPATRSLKSYYFKILVTTNNNRISSAIIDLFRKARQRNGMANFGGSGAGASGFKTP